ncbi:hypothetical protein T4B_10200 [Trichinella pseudospiralis]|uniref:Uncharacterized protein n=1 Tax=Trichinella pseudospiralis TaxID=6337 RepID=A0A0V1JXA4_TRIPS|nr:hypothetical protein T4B_10200 [Trichinella pseudospiralis]KRZ39581.1 hypothetical protein T4C_13782 [Trichinella pseudospiralis]
MKAVFGLLLTACCNHGMKEPVLDMQSEENYCFQRLILTYCQFKEIERLLNRSRASHAQHMLDLVQCLRKGYGIT